MKYIQAGAVILQGVLIQDAYLAITPDGRFGEVTRRRPSQGEIIDHSDQLIAPGLVDTHIHGYQQFDVMDCDPQGIEVMSQGLLACGVTSWLPTTLTDSVEQTKEACQVIASMANQVTGAKIRGIYLEGPFLSERYQGAQNPDAMRDPSIDLLREWQTAAQGLIKKIALAPERPGAIELIEVATDQGMHVALGHSDASYEEALQAFEAGASVIVHTYNGMRPLHHRDPGLVGAALARDHVYAEVIPDGHHVHPAALKILLKARGLDETVLITDCMRAGGIGDGASSLGPYPVTVQDGVARLTSSGQLAGSVLELFQGVRNLVDWQLATWPEAIEMASLNPARSVGIDDRCGLIAPGYEADFIVIDADGDLVATYLDGTCAYQAK